MSDESFTGPPSRARVESAVARGPANEARRLLLGAALEADDPEWIEMLALASTKRWSEPTVAGAGLLALAYVARRFRTIGAAEQAKDIIAAGLRAQDPALRGEAEDAADELRQFLGWDLGSDPLADWLAGRPVPGVAFNLNDAVRIEGDWWYAGQSGAVVSLLETAPEPLYLVELGATGEDVRVPQRALCLAAVT